LVAEILCGVNDEEGWGVRCGSVRFWTKNREKEERGEGESILFSEKKNSIKTFVVDKLDWYIKI
jgi:hypothetical protein